MWPSQGDRPPSDRPVGARRPRGDPSQRIISIASKDAGAAAGPSKDKDASSTASSVTTANSSNIAGFSSKTASEASAPSVAAPAPAPARVPARASVNVTFGLTDFKVTADSSLASLCSDAAEASVRFNSLAAVVSGWSQGGEELQQNNSGKGGLQVAKADVEPGMALQC